MIRMSAVKSVRRPVIQHEVAIDAFPTTITKLEQRVVDGARRRFAAACPDQAIVQSDLEIANMWRRLCDRTARADAAGIDDKLMNALIASSVIDVSRFPLTLDRLERRIVDGAKRRFAGLCPNGTIAQSDVEIANIWRKLCDRTDQADAAGVDDRLVEALIATASIDEDLEEDDLPVEFVYDRDDADEARMAA